MHDIGWESVIALAAMGLVLLAPRATGALVTTTGCAGATSCTLTELFAGGSITANTKRFADFELEFLDSDGVSPNFALVVVEGKDDGGLVPGNGIEFSGNGELVVVGADRLDMAIGFTVTELEPTVDMHDNSLTILSDTVVGTAFVRVGEFVADGSGVGLGQKQVETDPFFSPPITTDAIEFPIVQKKLIIEKDILLQSSAAGDSAELDVFEQRFSQLPEPNGSLMLCVGAGALWALRKLRSGRRTSST
jgi:hypothetical protein